MDQPGHLAVDNQVRGNAIGEPLLIRRQIGQFNVLAYMRLLLLISTRREKKKVAKDEPSCGI